MKKLFIVALLILGFSLLNAKPVSAANAVCIPATCPQTYVPDFGCVNKKLLDPQSTCCENKCPGTDGTTDPGIEKYKDYGILGLRVRITNASIPALINIAITTFLGIIALYALFRGIYVAGVKRTQATNEEDLAKINKELTSIVIGFVVAFSFIFIIQVVFNVLGLGGISNLNVNFDGQADPNSPQLVIKGSAE